MSNLYDMCVMCVHMCVYVYKYIYVCIYVFTLVKYTHTHRREYINNQNPRKCTSTQVMQTKVDT